MVRKNSLTSVSLLLVMLFAAASFGMVAAQQTQPTTQPTARQVQPTAQPTTASTTEYPYLGVRLVDTPDGIVVRQIMDGSPAASTSLKVGDMIEKINNTAAINVAAFATALDMQKADDKVALTVKSGDKEATINVTLGSTTHNETMITNNAFNAITFDSTTSEWQVFSLASSSDLASAGLQSGDTITQFNGKVYTPADLQTFLNGLNDTDQVKLTVKRAGKIMDVTAPASAFKSLILFNNSKEGMLLNLITASKNSQPSINIGDLNPTMPFDVFGYNLSNNVWNVYGLADNSALASAGLKPDDQITQFNGAAYDPASLQTFRAKLADSDMVKLTIKRAGKTMDISVPAATLNSLHLFDYQSDGMLFGVPANQFGSSVGLTTLPLTADLAKQHNLKQTDGVLVLEVFNNTAASAAGLQTNDVITAVNGQKVDAQHTLTTLLANNKPGDKVQFSIVRADRPMDITVTLAQPDISGEIPFLAPPL